MSNPKLEITVYVNNIREQTHMLTLIVNLQHYLRKLKIDKIDSYIDDPKKCHNFAKTTILKYKKLITSKNKTKRR